MQTSLLPIRITREVDARAEGYEGDDLKRLAFCDDSHTYAIKRVQDHPHMPICEWVGHHLCRRCGILTPDFAVLSGASDAEPPSFGSRIASYSQIEHTPLSFDMSRFFRGHTAAVAAVYALDAVVINPDRHGRNFFVRTDVAGDQLLAFDFSRAWLRTGQPFGNQEFMRDSGTSVWWKAFKRMGASVDSDTLTLLSGLDAPWLDSVGWLAALGQSIHDHRIIPRYSLSSEEAINVDFALRNTAMHYLQTADFRTASNQTQKRHEVQAKWFALGLAGSLTPLDLASSGVKTYAVIAGSDTEEGRKAIKVAHRVAQAGVFVSESSSDMEELLAIYARAMKQEPMGRLPTAGLN